PPAISEAGAAQAPQVSSTRGPAGPPIKHHRTVARGTAPDETALDSHRRDRGVPEADGPKLTETQRQRRGHDFYPTGQRANKIPRLGATRQQEAADIVLHEHYFVGGKDWWIAEW